MDLTSGWPDGGATPDEVENDPIIMMLALQSMDVGVFDYDALTTRQRFSRRCKALWGLRTDEEPTPERVESLVHPSDRVVVRAAAASLEASGPGWFAFEHRIVRPDGEVRWLESRGRTIFQGEGEQRRALRSVGTMRDITEVKRTQFALLEADRRKDEFIATLAHELRNPLAPIRNGLEIVRTVSPMNSPFQRTVEMMERQLVHLVHLVDDLLDVGRISSGKVELKSEPVALHQVLARSAETALPLINEQRHQLSFEPGDEHLYVNGDFERLTQVFSNLLSNAAKYTEHGGQIRLDVTREDQQAVVRVIDSGVGIPPEELPHVFDLFSQVRAHRTRAQGGFGIGLSLVRRLIEMHGGAVAAHSDGPQQGSTFTVRLPLAQALPDPAHSAPNAATTRRRARQRILVVDDNLDAAESLAILLEQHGHQVVIAHDGYEGVIKAASLAPSLVFLDLDMPRMDGFETARRLRQMPKAAEMRIIALTGWGQDQDQERTREAGFDLHLVKPIDPRALNEVLERVKPPSN